MNSNRVKIQLCDANGDVVFTCSPPVDVATSKDNLITWQGRVFKTIGYGDDQNVLRAHEVRVYAA